MRIPLAAIFLAIVSPAYAAAPYADDAAAVAAFFASSATLTSVAVADVEGPSPAAGGVSHALRAELFRLGVAVTEPNAEAAYALRGFLHVAPGRTTWLSSLWRKSDGRLAAAFARELGPPQPTRSREEPSTAEGSPRPAPPAASAARQRRAWSLSGGPHFRRETIGWLAGVLWACPTGRWEAGLDVGNYGSGKETIRLGIPTVNKADVWHARLKAGRIVPVAGNGLFDGWLPSTALLRGGLGLAFVQIRETVLINHAERDRNAVYYLRPVVDLGVRLKLTRRLAADLGLEWVPDLFGPGYVNRGGFAASTRLQF